MTGKMSYHANVHAARRLLDEIMPRVWRRRPDARLLIVGRNPPRALRRRARDAAGPVTVTGTVFDMRPYLHQAAVAVAPLVYGAGVQNKVLEAMASGLAVVASPCALAGLSPEASEGALCAEGSCGLAEHIADLLDRPDRAEALGRAGRAFVERHHRWDAMAERLQEVYAQLR
jgi:glycosyltransferase involved in cell wall biosynthesis